MYSSKPRRGFPTEANGGGTRHSVFESAETANSAPHIDVEKPDILREMSPQIQYSCIQSLSLVWKPSRRPAQPTNAQRCYVAIHATTTPGNFSLLALAILLMEVVHRTILLKIQQKKTSGQSADLRSAGSAGVDD